MKSSQKNANKKAKILAKMGTPRMAVLVVFMLVFASFGVYKLGMSNAATAPSVPECAYFGINYGLVLDKDHPYSQPGCTAAVQQLLTYNNYPSLKVDGIYGPVTALVVAGFQRTKGIPVTGKVDKGTWQYLALYCKTGTGVGLCKEHVSYPR